MGDKTIKLRQLRYTHRECLCFACVAFAVITLKSIVSEQPM